MSNTQFFCNKSMNMDGINDKNFIRDDFGRKKKKIQISCNSIKTFV